MVEHSLPARFAGPEEAFACHPGCTACCRGVLSLSVPELGRVGAVVGTLPPSQEGCPFRTAQGCAVYAVRPFMCRLFGFQYLHPGLRGQPFCPRFTRTRPGDREAGSFREYLAFCEEEGFVLLGQTPDVEEEDRAVADNRRALARHPEVLRFLSLLTGGERCRPDRSGQERP
ncbi:MAG: hypothetical protein GX442_06725 [Candidatus Riflebacteria bacterium]|nr:hypothetical protein [Candidatus Riflebacteria bacterium]